MMGFEKYLLQEEFNSSHVVSFSGGKDSTAMLLMMLEKGMMIDDIVFCDTGKEFPQMYEHISKVENYIGRKITILRNEKSFDYLMFDHIKKKGKNKGSKGYGWVNMRVRWCTIALKQKVFNRYMKGKKFIKYIGIAYDEPQRHQKIGLNDRHPLYDWKVTEKEALEYCYKRGFNWGGLYEHFDRVSCWCCPLKNGRELAVLYHYYPELWRALKDMDNKAYNKFKDKGLDYYEDKIIKGYKKYRLDEVK